MFFFFFNDTATTEIYTLSLHDALPISTLVTVAHGGDAAVVVGRVRQPPVRVHTAADTIRDRKSTRLDSSHDQISYAVFCLEKKKNTELFRGNNYVNHLGVVQADCLCEA